ncbi:MAG TPA: hypothetical protein ENN86_02775 [Desulfobacteraceae bacterium]|nr:hypothetical protein [Desulfobacteraceae bacterium]
MACFNSRIRGVFVDSPNIRLEIESPDRVQRGKYLIDFSQMDIEVRRNRGIGLEEYLNEPDRVRKVLKEDMEKGMDLFERLIIHSMSRILEKNEKELNALGVTIELPERPFPRFLCDRAKEKYGRDYEIKSGEETDKQFFWITGILRENYDLIYPYLKSDGKVSIPEITSEMI